MKNLILVIGFILGGLWNAQAQTETDMVVRALKSANPEVVTTYLAIM